MVLGFFLVIFFFYLFCLYSKSFKKICFYFISRHIFGKSIYQEDLFLFYFVIEKKEKNYQKYLFLFYFDTKKIYVILISFNFSIIFLLFFYRDQNRNSLMLQGQKEVFTLF